MKLQHFLILGSLFTAVLGCGVSDWRGNSLASGPEFADTEDSLFKRLSTPLSTAQIAAVRQTDLRAMYETLLAESDDAPFKIGGLTFVGTHSALLAHRAYFLAEATKYGTIGGQLDALGVDLSRSINREDLHMTLASMSKSSAQLALAPTPIAPLINAARDVADPLALQMEEATLKFSTLYNSYQAAGSALPQEMFHAMFDAMAQVDKVSWVRTLVAGKNVPDDVKKWIMTYARNEVAAAGNKRNTAQQEMAEWIARYWNPTSSAKD